MADYKTQGRHWCSDLVSVICRLEDGWRVTVIGNLEEIGESSALVLTDNKVGLGTKVVIRCKTRELKGVVESCTRDEGLGYFIEIGLDSECHWSQRWFAPQHLWSYSKLSA